MTCGACDSWRSLPSPKSHEIGTRGSPEPSPAIDLLVNVISPTSAPGRRSASKRTIPSCLQATAVASSSFHDWLMLTTSSLTLNALGALRSSVMMSRPSRPNPPFNSASFVPSGEKVAICP